MIGCTDDCGTTLDCEGTAWRTDEDAALGSAWAWLSIKGAWRCPACVRALDAAAHYAGTSPDPNARDDLPPTSRGALPKATADTIAAPVVARNPGTA